MISKIIVILLIIALLILFVISASSAIALLFYIYGDAAKGPEEDTGRSQETPKTKERTTFK